MQTSMYDDDDDMIGFDQVANERETMVMECLHRMWTLGQLVERGRMLEKALRSSK